MGPAALPGLTPPVTATLGRLLLISGLVILAGCGDPRRRAAEKTLREVGEANLRREAATLYKQLFVAPPGRYFEPKPSQWPPTFRRFKPLQVRAYADGFCIAQSVKAGSEEGLYVVPLSMDSPPREGRHAEFKKISEGIYWYQFSE